MNFGTPVPLLIGIILILGALALFFLEKFRPGYERDSDKVYAVLLLIAGLFLLAHLDMELLASFQQLLMAGMLTTLLIENIRSRFPRAVEQGPPISNRPPRPGYDNRQPPPRRVYRAELDDRGIPIPAGGAFDDRNRPPRMAPAADPRMAPARNSGEYWRSDYDDSRAAPRQPYEEYRGPAGRLQPSEAPRPRDVRDNGYRPDDYGNGRYGERPPARPPVGQSVGQSVGQTRGQAPAGRPPESPPERPPERPDNQNFQQRPPERRPDEGQPGQRRPDRDAARDAAQAGNPSRSNPERSLNVRPYSEAPQIDSQMDSQIDSPEDDGYRPKEPSGSDA